MPLKKLTKNSLINKPLFGKMKEFDSKIEALRVKKEKLKEAQKEDLLKYLRTFIDKLRGIYISVDTQEIRWFQDFVGCVIDDDEGDYRIVGVIDDKPFQLSKEVQEALYFGLSQFDGWLSILVDSEISEYGDEVFSITLGKKEYKVLCQN